MAADMQLVTFEEICEITGEVNTYVFYEPVDLEVSLDDNNSK